MNSLFEKTKLGGIEVANRIVMAPLTRCRASPGRVPNELMKEYYVQRASAGLIITEATAISPQGVGYPDTPGLWSEDQVAGWKNITDAVHKAGGKMIVQLWHVGRISHSLYLNGDLPVAPSAIKAAGHVSLVRPLREYETPRALSTVEVKQIVNDYKVAAQNAKKAGFDGVHLHGANGYLPDQFLESSTNQRTDEYGGSLENRARFMLEITDALLTIWDSSLVGIHLSPRGTSHDLHDQDPKATYGYLMREFKRRKLGYLAIRERQDEGYLTPYLKQEFGGQIIANESIDPKNAESLVQNGSADFVAFGRLYISNPDLVERMRNHQPLQELNASTIYAEGATGYTDYPSLKSP